jgi:hypothetical protein
VPLDRPTRWAKAKQDWRGFRIRRESIGGAIGTTAGIVALIVLGFPGAALENVIVILATGAVVAVLVPVAELAWSWLQAPMRLLTADVAAIRERLDAQPAPKAAPRVNVRKPPLKSQPRYGGDGRSTHPSRRRTRMDRGRRTATRKHGKRGDAERFLSASTRIGSGGMADRVRFIRELAEEYD